MNYEVGDYCFMLTLQNVGRARKHHLLCVRRNCSAATSMYHLGALCATKIISFSGQILDKYGTSNGQILGKYRTNIGHNCSAATKIVSFSGQMQCAINQKSCGGTHLSGTTIKCGLNVKSYLIRAH